MGGKLPYWRYRSGVHKPWPKRESPPAWRVALGFFVAPAVASILMGSLMPAFDGLSMPERVAKSATIYAAFGAYPSAILFGVPAYLMLRRHMGATLLNCSVVAAVVAAFPWLIVGVLPSGAEQESVGGRATVIDGHRTIYGWLLQGQGVLEVAAFGAVAGIAFWFIVVGPRRTA